MDKLKYIKLENEDGSYSNSIPIGAEASNVDVDGESVATKLNKKPYYFDTVADMKADTKLKVGDMAVTLGFHKYNDGKGAFYKIREIKNTDVVDDNNIVALHDPDLVAEKILFSSGYEIQSYLQGQIDQITQTSVATEMVVFGDSWSDLSVTESLWPTSVAGELRLHLHDYAVNGAGFVSPANNLIETQITTAQSDTTYNKNYVKFVVLCGGINDYRNSVDFEILRQKICDLYNSCKTIFPNAKILYVNNFQYPYTQTQSAFWYKLQYNLSTFGVSALNQDGFFKEQFFVANLYHLTQSGQQLFGSNIMSALTGGQIKNDGVTIHFNLTNTYLWMKRIDNMVMYTLFVNNLSSTDTQTITANEDLCWVDNFADQFMNCVGQGFRNAIAQVNNDNTILIAKSNGDITKLYYSGNVPISIEL